MKNWLASPKAPPCVRDELTWLIAASAPAPRSPGAPRLFKPEYIPAKSRKVPLPVTICREAVSDQRSRASMTSSVLPPMLPAWTASDTTAPNARMSIMLRSACPKAWAA